MRAEGRSLWLWGGGHHYRMHCGSLGMGAGAEGGVTGRQGGEVGRGGHGGSESQWGQQAKQFQQVLVED